MTQKRTLLLTGGAGYIGSHTYLALIESGYDVVILDDFSNAKHSVLDRLAHLSGAPVTCINGDVLDPDVLQSIFEQYPISGVIHFAARKSVGESISMPLEYIETNCSGLVLLLKAMRKAKVFNLVFSSSATVYGDAKLMPIPETTPLTFTNPYGYTKLMGEQILEQVAASDPRWAFGTLRYFNPVGAHPSGMIGEDPTDIPNNLMPYIAKVAIGELPHLQVFGDDYDTPDGTGVRDYIHVSDLARGHVLSLNALFAGKGHHCVNLGTGKGYSVLEMLAAYSAACGHALDHKIAPRRSGDIGTCYADVTKAQSTLGFTAEHSLEDMCNSSWAWVQYARKLNSEA
jgi:UDP-glucose 4-epimerase